MNCLPYRKRGTGRFGPLVRSVDGLLEPRYKVKSEAGVELDGALIATLWDGADGEIVV